MQHVDADLWKRPALGSLVTTLFVVGGCGCVSLKPSDIPVDEDYIVVVRSRHVQRPWIGWSHHSWIEVKDGNVPSRSEWRSPRRRPSRAQLQVPANIEIGTKASTERRQG